MSHRIRNSNARPTASRHSTAATPRRNVTAATPSRNVTDELPAYKKPSHPLDLEATRQLRELQGRNLNDVKKHNKQALETITSTAESINDMLREHSDYIARRQKKWDVGKNLDDREDEERAMEELQESVEEATTKLEESMRAVIDSGIAAQRIDETLDWLRQHAPKQLEDEYNTQMTQRATQRQSQMDSQRRRTHNADGEDESAAEELDDGPTPGPTPLDGTRVALTGVSEHFADRQQRQKDIYTSLSLTARYARNNEYRDFKRIVHDAKYGDAGPTLGHEDTWFTETGSPAPGITNTQRGAFDDDDDDIIMDKATISTRCPITFQQFKEPFTSTKCPHTFERNAIVDMIRTSGGPRGAGPRMVRCPVTGCDQSLTLNDLRSDPILIRKIKRMQQAEAAEAEESSEDEIDQPPSRGPRHLDGSNDTPASSSRLQIPSTQRPPRSSVVEDLGDPSEDESESQQPPTGSTIEDLGDPSDSEAEL